MKAEFYDVKAKAKVEAQVVDAVQLANGRFALKGKTSDGRSLTLFVAKAKYDEAKASLK